MSMTKQEIWKQGREYRKANNIRKEVKFHKEYDKRALDQVQKVLKEGRYLSFNSYVISLIERDMAIEHYGLTEKFSKEINEVRKREQKKENN